MNDMNGPTDIEPWHLPHMNNQPNDAALCCNFNCNQGRTCPRRTMKPSHLQTPRTLNECHFTPGYVSAEPEHKLTTLGHLAVTVAGLLIIVVLVAVEIGGWLGVA